MTIKVPLRVKVTDDVEELELKSIVNAPGTVVLSTPGASALIIIPHQAAVGKTITNSEHAAIINAFFINRTPLIYLTQLLGHSHNYLIRQRLLI